MKKTLIALISAATLAVIVGVASSASVRRGADDACGGCPKDFACAIVGGVPRCVPEPQPQH